MKVDRKDLEKSLIELSVEVSLEELEPYIIKGAESLSKEVKIEGFRPGKVPLEILKQKIGEMPILEEAARLIINKQIDDVILSNTKDKQIVGRPEVNITKLAPGNPLEYKITLISLPEIKLGEYKDLGFKKEDVSASSEDINKLMNNLLEMRAVEKISDQVIKDGDKVLVSINLFLDKVPVEDGQSSETTVIIGKNYLIDGFDKNLLGLKKGEEKSFSLVYPKDHYKKNLAGKKVEFKVKIKEVYDRQVPEASDEIAQAFRFKNLKDLEDNLKTSIESQKKRDFEIKLESQIIDKIIDKTKFGEIPEELIKNESEIMLREIEQSVLSQGGKFEDYLNSIKKNQEQLKLDILPQAVQRVKGALVLREIAKLEKIKVEDKEIEVELDKARESSKGNAEALKSINSPAYRSYLNNFLINQKTVDQLKDWNLS